VSIRRFCVVLLAGSAACVDSPVGDQPDPPAEVLGVAVRTEAGPIFRNLVLGLDRPSRVLVDYWTTDGDRLRVETPAAATDHELFLPRLRAGRTYSYEARAVTEVGDTGIARAGTFSTGPLSPPLAALRSQVTGRASFDLLVLEIGRPTGSHLPVIVDTRGQVVWHSVQEGRAPSGFTLFEDSLFALNTPQGIRVVSPRSQEERMSLTRARAAQRTGIDPFFIHHDLIATPSGTLLFLVQDRTTARDTVWTGEAVWEWNPRTDELARRWRSGDFLNPARDRGPRSTPDDWLHANSLARGPRGNVLVSFFWLHEVLSISPDWQRVEWRLGGPASTFRGVERAMEAGQHTAAEVAPDRVLLFDNGLDRAGGRFSRALELRLDRALGDASVVWEFAPMPAVFAPIVSSVRRLPNGSTVVAFGLAAGFQAGGATASGPLVIYEVAAAGEVVWRMEIVEGADLVYRATPLASIAGERVVCAQACVSR
jgi:hypothetical protein